MFSYGIKYDVLHMALTLVSIVSFITFVLYDNKNKSFQMIKFLTTTNSVNGTENFSLFSCESQLTHSTACQSSIQASSLRTYSSRFDHNTVPPCLFLSFVILIHWARDMFDIFVIISMKCVSDLQSHDPSTLPSTISFLVHIFLYHISIFDASSWLNKV